MFECRAYLDTAQRELTAQRAAAARQLVAVGHYARGRMAELGNTHEEWIVDDGEAVAVEVATELGVSRGRAAVQMNHGQTLIERLPKFAEVFVAGEVDYGHFTVIAHRTALIIDPDVLAAVDAQLAARAPGWNAKSRDRVAELVDWMVIDVDPDAVRVARQAYAGRHIGVTPTDNGVAEIYGRIGSPDAAVFDKRLDELARTVCADDPRTLAQRRADAVRPLSEGADRLECACGSPDCPAATSESTPKSIVIHVLAEQATLDGTSDAPALLPGYGAVPAEQVRTLAARARVRPLRQPQDLAAEHRYRPSAVLTEFVRARDLTCRWPGCDVAAEVCDVDHTTPWPAGATHPSNNKLYCRVHHLVKTFYTGPSGWTDAQARDGTVTLTSPIGRVYTTTPGGALFFPQLGTPTAELPTAPAPTTADRGISMPTRRRTRAMDRAYRIAYERALNRARADADPPPF